MNEIEDQTFEHIEVVPPEPAREPVVYKQEGRLFLEEGAELPLQPCICCGRKASKVITKQLRNPRNPLTWFGKTKLVKLGLCRKHADNNGIGIALTWSSLVVGLLMLGVGAATLTVSAIVLGVLAALASGVFRAAMPISTVNPKDEPVEIRGFAPRYLDAIEIEMAPPVYETEESPETR